MDPFHHFKREISIKVKKGLPLRKVLGHSYQEKSPSGDGRVGCGPQCPREEAIKRPEGTYREVNAVRRQRDRRFLGGLEELQTRLSPYHDPNHPTITSQNHSRITSQNRGKSKPQISSKTLSKMILCVFPHKTGHFALKKCPIS